MSPEDDLTEELLSLYRRTGEATRTYWPHRFLAAVRRHGGLPVAKKLLAPGQPTSSGFDRLVAARRADLLVESIALDGRFSQLFDAAELAEARRRLDELPPEAFPEPIAPLETAPDEVADEESYPAGAVRHVTINDYERSAKARAMCLKHHGRQCAVCGMEFEKRYGDIGEGFIHVHHKRPLGSLKTSYRLNPKRDLVPVCPNCHAMPHTRTPPLDVEQLRALLMPR